MSESKHVTRLTESDIAEVKQQALSKLGECRKTQDVIGTQIFSLLSLNARVIYYPLGKTGPWGITYMWGIDSANSSDKPFVVINTSIPVDAQVFAAAHELYHIWYDKKAESIPASILGEIDEFGAQLDVSELKANRFAAEFLVDDELLRQEMRIYSISKHKTSEKSILLLASLFTVPYKTMVKRLFEIDVIGRNDRDQYLLKSENDVDQLRKRFSFTIPDCDEKIAIDNLVELSVAMYEKQRISYEKLQFLLSMSGLEPRDVGVAEPQAYVPPNDDELDDIMEE